MKETQIICCFLFWRELSSEEDDSIPQLDGNISPPYTPSKTPKKSSPRTSRTRTPKTTPKRKSSGRYIPLEMLMTSNSKVSNENKNEESDFLKRISQLSKPHSESALEKIQRIKSR